MNQLIFGPATITGVGRSGSISDAWYYTPSQVAIATITTGDVPPDTPATVALKLRVSPAAYVTVATLAAGSAPNTTYRLVFRMADFATIKGWDIGELSFSSDQSHPVTGAAWIDGVPPTAIDSTPIGATTPSTGAFTTLAATSIDSTPIGATTPSTGKFTSLAATLGDYADDAAAATGGVPVGGLYQTSGAVKVRVS